MNMSTEPKPESPAELAAEAVAWDDISLIRRCLERSSHPDAIRALNRLAAVSAKLTHPAPAPEARKCRACVGSGEDFNEGDPCHLCKGTGIASPSGEQS